LEAHFGFLVYVDVGETAGIGSDGEGSESV
jgi:hypothetical protein